MEIQYIIKVISSLKLDDSINAWKNGIIRTLQKFEDNHTEVQGEKCPECGGTLIREGGCIHCKDCGWTRCE
jgi:ribonucleoside-diphosphate reductase alpha chain